MITFNNKLQRNLLNIQEIIVKLLIFLIPSQLAYHYWPSWSFIFGMRIDYLSPTVFLTDMLIVILLFLGLLSLTIQGNWKKKIYEKLPKGKHLNIVVIFFVLIIINIFFSSYSYVALIKWIRVLVLFCLGLYVIYQPKLDVKKWIMYPAIYSSIFFGLIGIVQFFIQRTIGGVLYFVGERSFTSNTAGIAKITIGGREYMRSYSTFSHPNSLGGYLFTTLFMVVAYFKKYVKTKNIIFYVFIAIPLLAILLSFSKSVFIVFVITVLLFAIYEYNKILFGKLVRLMFITSVVLSVLFAVYSRNIAEEKSSNIRMNIEQRLLLADVSGQVFAENPLFGIGMNNFIYEVPSRSVGTGLNWWLQPVHNIFLLVLAELGITGLLIFVYGFYKVINKALEKDRAFLIFPLLIILFTGIFDHYWLTLQQNQILLAIIAGLVFRKEV